MPKLSVVMSVYNAEKYVQDSIDSILNQSYEDFEFVIINDGSTDATASIIEKIKDNRILFVSYNKNRGSVPCLQEAIDRSSGTFIATQDADDISISNRLELQMQFMEKNNDVFCLGGRAIKIDENSNLIGEWNFPPETHDGIVKMLTREKKCPIINPTSLFRKADYVDIGGYSTDASVVASYDLELWCKSILANKKFANLPNYLIKYRWHKDSMTQRLKFQQIAAYNKIMSNFIRKIKYESTTKMDRSRT